VLILNIPLSGNVGDPHRFNTLKNRISSHNYASLLFCQDSL